MALTSREVRVFEVAECCLTASPARVMLTPQAETDPDCAGCGVVDDDEAAVPNWRTLAVWAVTSGPVEGLAVLCTSTLSVPPYDWTTKIRLWEVLMPFSRNLALILEKREEKKEEKKEKEEEEERGREERRRLGKDSNCFVVRTEGAGSVSYIRIPLRDVPIVQVALGDGFFCPEGAYLVKLEMEHIVACSTSIQRM